MNKALPVSTNTKTSVIILQILEGKQHNIKMFGYSLAGNMDLDQNSYPDLAVGSLSDTVFIYRCWQQTFHVKVVTWRFMRCYSNIPLVCRSKTVISIKKDIKVTPKEIDLMKKTCGNSIWWDSDKTRTSKASLIDVLDILNSAIWEDNYVCFFTAWMWKLVSHIEQTLPPTTLKSVSLFMFIIRNSHYLLQFFVI